MKKENRGGVRPNTGRPPKIGKKVNITYRVDPILETWLKEQEKPTQALEKALLASWDNSRLKRIILEKDSAVTLKEIHYSGNSAISGWGEIIAMVCMEFNYPIKALIEDLQNYLEQQKNGE